MPTQVKPKAAVGIVSKRYAMVQHGEIAQALLDGVAAIGNGPIQAKDISCACALSDYGERMLITISVPGIEFERLL